MKGLVTLLVLVAISAGVFVMGSMRRESDDKPLLSVAEEVALTIVVAKPEREDIVRLVQAPGEVEPVLEVDISSEIFAKIEEMPIEEGDLVSSGQLLCRLDDNKLVAELESSEARIAQLEAAIMLASADAEKADRDCNRQKRLSESNATSDSEILDYLTVWKKANAALKMREFELVQAQAMRKRLVEDLNRTVIKSPIDGVISRLQAKQGEVVITGTMNNPGTVIMTVSDLSKMQVRARVDEVDVPLVHKGQKARLYLQSDSAVPVPAEVVRVATKGNRLTGRDVVTFETLLEVQSDDPRIKPGMTANVEIEVDYRAGAITVPIEAVVHRMRKDLPEEIVEEFDKKQSEMDLSDRARQAQYIKVIYVMDDEVAKVRLVDAGIADTRRVELREGISMDETVIIGPYRSLDQLEDGKKVALADEDKDKDKDETDAESEKLAEGEKSEDGSVESADSDDDDKAVASSTSP